MKSPLLWVYHLGLESLVSSKLFVLTRISPFPGIFIASLPHKLSDV